MVGPTSTRSTCLRQNQWVGLQEIHVRPRASLATRIGKCSKSCLFAANEQGDLAFESLPIGEFLCLLWMVRGLLPKIEAPGNHSLKLCAVTLKDLAARSLSLQISNYLSSNPPEHRILRFTGRSAPSFSTTKPISQVSCASYVVRSIEWAEHECARSTCFQQLTVAARFGAHGPTPVYCLGVPFNIAFKCTRQRC